MATILIVEDDIALAELIVMQLEDAGHDAVAVHSVGEARNTGLQERFDLVLLDYQLPDGYGLDLQRDLLAALPRLPIIMMTGVNDSRVTIEAIKEGAYDFIRKPMNEQELISTINSALQTAQLAKAAGACADDEDEVITVDNIIGASRAITEVCKSIGRISESSATVLITGESGTGKEVVARAIHHHSGRTGIFLPINCSALVDNLLESELFGHEKGSFTGATQRKPGKFEEAGDGTLFLDEIGELPASLQAKLLRVLQEGTFMRVGGNETLTTSARVLAATHRNLQAMVAADEFREDLYYRLNVVNVYLPPLRERREDIALLVPHLVSRINRRLQRDVKIIDASAWAIINAYPWPGNVRELENNLTRAILLAPGQVVTGELLDIAAHAMAPFESGDPADAYRPQSLDALEARHVEQTLIHTQWHKGNACTILGISRPALERKIKKYSIGLHKDTDR